MRFIPALIMSILMLAGPPLQASSIEQIDTTELMKAPQLIFQGEVVNRQSRQEANGRIYTYVDFQVQDVLAGDFEAGKTLTLRFAGGQVGDLGFSAGVRIPELGEKGVYFVESLDRKLLNPLLGWSQGRFEVQPDGSLKAGNGERVTALDLVEADPVLRLSKGVARGIETRPLGQRSRGVAQSPAMSLQQFKARVRELREELTP